MPRISVVIPTYNRSAQVPDAIRCVLEQSLPPHEVIVIDDGSTDDTTEALAQLLGKIRYIRTENRGVSAARNLGIREATGDWIAFQDSDDTWHPDKLRRQAECVAANGAKVCFCVCTNEAGEPIDGMGAMDPDLSLGGCAFYPTGDFRIFKRPGHPVLQTMLARKTELLELGGFDESLRVAEDHELIHRLVFRHGYALLNERMVVLCRKRSFTGLSDAKDAHTAFINHQCYIRVWSAARARLMAHDPGAAAMAGRRLLYFLSRQAEIASVLGHSAVAKSHALAGLSLGGTARDFARNLLVLLAYPLARRAFLKKWKTGIEQDPQP